MTISHFAYLFNMTVLEKCSCLGLIFGKEFSYNRHNLAKCGREESCQIWEKWKIKNSSRTT